MTFSTHMRSTALFLGFVFAMTVLASVVGYAPTALSHFAGVKIEWWISIALVGAVAAWSAYALPAALTWPRASRIAARVVASLTVFVMGLYYSVILALAVHGK